MNTIFRRVLFMIAWGLLSDPGILSADSFPTKQVQAFTMANIAQTESPESRPVLPAKKAVAALNPTKGNQANGMVNFVAVEGGVRITAKVEGLTPGKHGFHIHEYGDCSSPDGSSAGGHFNPMHQRHGGPDHHERHAGDLGNIVADESGIGHYDRIDNVITLNGPNSIIGKSVIVHANPDDFKTQPSGNAGGRIACGVIAEK
jgi:superoxide dismutase, Cu-Zn family